MVERPVTRLKADASGLTPEGCYRKTLEHNFHRFIQGVLGLLRNFPAT